MAEFQATPSQLAAMETRGRSILVSAGAGSGKTKVLTERLMRYILDADTPENIDRFVIITFTQAAAAELRSRISDELAKASAAAEKDPGCSEERKKHLRRQQALIRSAPIGTIHHFCTLILRENGHTVGLTSDFKIASEERAAGMKEEILNHLLEQRYEHMEQFSGFEELVNSVGTGRDDSELAATVRSLYEKMQSHPRPEAWAARCVAALRTDCTDVGATLWGKELLSGAAATADYWVREMDAALAAMAAEPDTFAAYGEGIAAGADSIREFARCLRLGWDRARSCPLPAFGKLKALREAKKTALSEKVKKRKNDCLAQLKKVYAQFSASSDTLEEELHRTAPPMEALLQLTLDFDAAYTSEKRRQGIADYADLEHCTARLLTEERDGALVPTELAMSIAERYREIMIDEYQDVSRVQEAIFRAVSRQGKNLFMVGDVKQAIYRFRLADPEIFNEKYRSYSLLEEAAEGTPAKILLRENFRSRREILECANSVFSACMTRTLGDIDYDEAASLKFGSLAYPDAAPVPEVWILGRDTGDGDAPEREKTEQEAAFVAGQIEALVRSGETVTGKNGPRPMTYGDIAILLRNANSVGGAFRRALQERGIPVVSGQGGGFFESREISFVLSLLRVMDDPHNEVELAAVLRSPLFGFSADALAGIRAAAPGADTDFYSALKKRAETDPACSAFLATLRQLRAEAPDLTAEKLIRRILLRTELLPVCAAMPDGDLRTANLMRLIRIAGNFEADGYHGLHRFVRYLLRLKEKSSELSASEAAENCVQILSVHKSKGLEFPVVFLCDTARQFNLRDSTESVLVHPELGLGPRVTDETLKLRYPSLARIAITQRIRRETLSEEMRLLYVALTRPKERLFITGLEKVPEDYLAKQHQRLPLPGGKLEPEMLMQSRRYLDWVVLAALADEETHLKIRTFAPTAEEGQETEAVSVPAQPEAEAEAEKSCLDTLEANLSYAYPHAGAEHLPSKITATELKHGQGSEAAAGSDPDAGPETDPEAELLPAACPEPACRHFRRPDFSLRDQPITATERGIATHLCLQYMDVSKAETLGGVRAEIARLLAGGYLSVRQASSVDAPAIVKLFTSPLGERIRHADAVHREFRFSLLCDASRLLPSASAGEEILLQGVVDCCLEEAGELVILDYKTDRVFTPEQIAERRDRYAGQVRAYAHALGRIFHMPVKETVLYFLSCGKSVAVKAAEDDPGIE